LWLVRTVFRESVLNSGIALFVIDVHATRRAQLYDFGVVPMARYETEIIVRDLCFVELFKQLGKPGTLIESGNKRKFDLREPCGTGTCCIEGALSYVVPSGDKVSHTSDILVTCFSHFCAIECKFLSAVSDQFKCRAYDMLQLKRSLGEQVIGIMVYVHVPGCGISLGAAKAYCYPFDHFVGLTLKEPQALESISFKPIVDIVQSSIALAQAARS
jgi:hypothetical protein